MESVEKPKKTIKNLRDIEKVMRLMQENRISKIVVDGVELEIHSFKSDIQNMVPQTRSQESSDDALFWSS